MLGKLMKYELKATARTLIPLYISLLVFAIINKFFIGVGIADYPGFGSIPFILSIFGYGFTMAAVFIVTFFVIIQRFYKNLLGDEGYLMNTLPITTTTNLTSKISISTLWTIVSSFVAVLSILIMTFKPDSSVKFFHELFLAFSQGYAELGIQFYIAIIEIIVICLIFIVKSITMIYASISIGHLFNKHKILSSFGAFLVLNLITTTLISVLRLTDSSTFQSIFDSVNIQSFFHVHLFLIFIILYNLVFFIAYFIINNYILKNKLNLE
jgi:hypothetical protein